MGSWILLFAVVVSFPPAALANGCWPRRPTADRRACAHWRGDAVPDSWWPLLVTAKIKLGADHDEFSWLVPPGMLFAGTSIKFRSSFRVSELLTIFQLLQGEATQEVSGRPWNCIVPALEGL